MDCLDCMDGLHGWNDRNRILAKNPIRAQKQHSLICAVNVFLMAWIAWMGCMDGIAVIEF